MNRGKSPPNSQWKKPELSMSANTLDTFTDLNYRFLENHTPDSGGAWNVSTPGTLQISADLTSWTTLATLMPGASPYVFTDITASGEAQRFYRALYE